MQTNHGSILRPYSYTYYSFSTLPFYPQMSFGVFDLVTLLQLQTFAIPRFVALRETPLLVIQWRDHMRILLANSTPLLFIPLAIALLVTIVQSNTSISSSRPTFLLITLWSDSETNHVELGAATVLHEQFVTGLVNAKLVVLFAI